jgi:hypothetical protein
MELLGTGNLQSRKLAPIPFKDGAAPASAEALAKEGYAIFALGPLYVYAGIEDDILERFAADECTERALKGRQPVGGQIHFEHNVLARCEKWNKTLTVLDIESYGFFNSWMLAQTFVNRKARKYYVPRKMTAPMLDPLALTHNKQIAIALDVYTVSGIYARICPKCLGGARKDAKHFIDFEKCDPEPHVVTEGKMMLQMTGV